MHISLREACVHQVVSYSDGRRAFVQERKPNTTLHLIYMHADAAKPPVSGIGYNRIADDLEENGYGCPWRREKEEK